MEREEEEREEEEEEGIEAATPLDVGVDATDVTVDGVVVIDDEDDAIAAEALDEDVDEKDAVSLSLPEVGVVEENDISTPAGGHARARPRGARWVTRSLPTNGPNAECVYDRHDA